MTPNDTPTFKPTAQVQARAEYTLQVSKEELRLICLALAGKLGSGSGLRSAVDHENARALNVRLLKMAHHSLSAQLDSLENALETLDASDKLVPVKE